MKGQSKIVYDTIIVYDTVRVYDTVYVEEISSNQRYAIKIIQDSSFIQFFFDKKHATFFKPVIIAGEIKQNTIAMKKISFLGIVFFAFKSMVVAQTTIGVSAGPVAWGTTDRLKNVSNPLSMGIRFGGFAQTRIINSLALEVGLNYFLLNKERDIKVKDVNNPKFSGEVTYVNDFNNTLDMQSDKRNLFSLHANLVGKLGKFRISGGPEFNYALFKQTKTYTNPPVTETLNMGHNDFGFIVGLGYKFTERIEINSNYFRGINTNWSLYSEPSGSYAVGYNYQRMELSLRYYLR